MTDTKPYPGIPPGILDEELEEKTSEKKGPFEGAIKVLGKELLYWPDWKERVDSCRQAIRTLEAAGKVDKADALAWLKKAFVDLDDIPVEWLKPGTRKVQIVALVEALPEIEEEPRHYRCESCGKEFDKKLFSHSRAGEDGNGNPIEIECGPISGVK